MIILPFLVLYLDSDNLPYRRMSRIFDEDDSARVNVRARRQGPTMVTEEEAEGEEPVADVNNRQKGEPANSGRGSPPSFTAAPVYLSYAPDEDTNL